MKIRLSGADQVGIVVQDLDSFLEQLEELLGIDGFEIIEYPPEDRDVRLTHYGEKASFRLRMAFGRVGRLEFEIIQPLEGQSIFHDFLREHGPGLHHIRFTEPEYEQIVQSLQEAGIVKMASGDGVHGPTQWAYFDTREWLEGVIIEIKKPLP